MTDKTLTIKIHTDLGDAVAAQNTLQKAIQGTGAALQQVSTTAKNFFNGANWEIEYDHIVKVTGAINALKSAEAAVKGISGLNTATIRGGSTGADLAVQFKQESALATSALKDRLNTEQALRQNSGNTILQTQRTAAADEKAIHAKLAADILAIERNLATGSITTVNAATQQRIALERTAAKDITALRKSIEVAQAKVTARVDSASIYRRETQEIQAELQRRMQLEQSIRINGANNVQTLAIRTAQEETRIMQNASRQILTIEQQLQNGIIQNRGAANAMRTAILSRAEAQITSNRVVLEAAQLEQRNADAITNAANAHKNLIIRAAEFIGIYRVLNGIINQVTTAIQSIPKVGIEKEATLASLSATVNGAAFGASGGSSSVFKALTEEAHRTGIEISTVRENFRTFQASASLAGEALKDVWKMFTDINTVSTALHLSTDKVQLTFLAISQIFNKTKVQSEELVKQLGNLLPGAFASFVQANKLAGESTQEASLRIIKAMKAGTVAAHETIKNFTSFYSERFAGAFALARSGLNANLGDMQTSFQLLGEAIYNLNSGPILAVVKGLSSAANGLTSLITASGELKTNLQGGINIALGLFSGYIIGLIANSALVTQAIVGLKAAFITLNLYIDTAIVSLATLGPEMTVVAIATDIASIAMKGFTAVLSFLASPILVIAGIATIGKGIWDLQKAAENTGESIKKMNEEFDKQDKLKAAKKAGDKQLEINLLVEQDRLVIKAKENLLNATERLQKLETSNRNLGIAATKEELEWQNKKVAAVTAYGRAVLAATDSINSQKAAEEENAKSFVNMQLGSTGETEAKRLKDAEELRTLQDKYNKNIIDINNAEITAQIKETERLTKAKVDSFKLEAELAEENFKLGKITSKQLADTKIDLLEKEKAVFFRMSNEKAALQAKELTDTINNVKAAHEAIRMIESSGGTNREPNISYKKDGSWNGTMLGPGQMSITNLTKGTEVTPPFDPAIKSKIMEFKTDTIKLREWVEQNWIGLGDISEKYFYGLVDKFFKKTGDMEKAIRLAVTQYGEHTPEYMAKFEKTYAIMNKSAEETIKINDRVTASEQEKAETMMRIAKEQVTVREELAKANAIADKAQLDSLDKMLVKTASAEEAYQATITKLISLESQVNSKGQKFVTPENAIDIKDKAIKDFNIAKDKELSTPIDKAIPAVKRYDESLKHVNNTTKEFGSISNNIFSASLKGFSQLAGITQQLVESQKNLSDNLVNEETKYQEALAGIAASKYADPAQREKDLFELKKKHGIILRQNEEESLQNTLGGISQMMAATSQMFAQNSTEAKAFNIIALAGLAAKAAAAMLTQGEGDPYTAFARIAAMGSVVASIMATAGAGGFNFSKTTSSMSESQTSHANGTGTILGNTTTASTSTTKIVDLLKNIHAEEYKELRGINTAVNLMASNISTTVNRVFQGGGMQSVDLSSQTRLSTTANNAKLAVMVAEAIFAPMTLGISLVASKLPVIGSAISKVVNWFAGGLFGKISHAIIGTGISTGDTSTNALLNGGTVNPQRFDVDQTTKSSWFKTTYKYDVIFSKLDKNVSSALNSVFDNMGAVMLSLSKELGHDLESKLRAYIIPSLTIDLKGLSGEDASKKLNGILSATLDTMATTVFGGIIGQYQKLGEGMLETAIRIVSEVAVVKDALASSGLNLADNAIGISDALVQAANGLEGFQNQLSVFYDKFFTDEEKQAKLASQLASQLADTFPPETIQLLSTARVTYREVLKGININTIAGQEQYSTLLRLAGAADTYYTSLETNSKTAQQTLDTSLSDAQSKLTAAYNKESSALKDTINKMDSFSKSLRTLKDSLLLGTLSPLTPLDKYIESKRQYEESKAIIAQGPGTTDASKALYDTATGEITSKLQEFLTNSQIYNASSDAYQKDFQSTLQDIASGITNTEIMKSDAQKQLDTMTMQVSTLITINESVLSVHDAVMALLQVQNTNGIAGQIVVGQYEATKALGRSLTTEESNWIDAQFKAGRSKEDIYAEASAYIKAQIDGSHADGLHSVPFDGYIAKLHKNERVLTATQAKESDGVSQEILAELKYLREAVSKFNADHNDGTGAIIQHTYYATEKAANTIVEGGKAISKDIIWANKSKVELI